MSTPFYILSTCKLIVNLSLRATQPVCLGDRSSRALRYRTIGIRGISTFRYIFIYVFSSEPPYFFTQNSLPSPNTNCPSSVYPRLPAPDGQNSGRVESVFLGSQKLGRVCIFWVISPRKPPGSGSPPPYQIASGRASDPNWTETARQHLALDWRPQDVVFCIE